MEKLIIHNCICEQTAMGKQSLQFGERGKGYNLRTLAEDERKDKPKDKAEATKQEILKLKPIPNPIGFSSFSSSSDFAKREGPCSAYPTNPEASFVL